MAHYTYLWLREDGRPYYAGKGRGRRGFTSHKHCVRCPRDRTRIILQEWPSHQVALEAEKFLIACYGRKDNGTGCLRNLTDGGEGTLNLSAEARRRIGEAGKGRRPTTETMEKMRAAALGRIRSAEARAKGAVSNKGRFVSQDTRRKIGDKAKGRKHSMEARQKISVAALGNKKLLGYKHTPETRARMSLSQRGNQNRLGCTQSIESRAKIGAARRGLAKAEVTG